MRFAILCILCASVLVPREVVALQFAFQFFRELLFPRTPMVNKVRHLGEGRALGDDFAVLDTVGLVEKHGYPAEEHNVTTEDGYNLVFFRIPGSPRSPATKGKPVVFLQHGIFASSDAWVLRGPDLDLAFLLADEGYDVWLGNIRGNSYGRSHTSFCPQDQDFWNFSFHEIGMWDLPRMIDHALENSGEETLFYIGHSMGTTAAYILLSERPEYNDRMRLVVSLAPIAMWKGAPNPFIEFAVLNGEAMKTLLDANGIYELAPQTENNVRLGRAFCSDNSITQSACAAFYFMLAGDDPKQLNSSLLPYLSSYIPAGVSTDTLYHYRQNMISGTFQKFDFGYAANFRLYRKKRPPIYDVKKISAPIAIIYGKNDIISIESNTAELVKRLQNVVTCEAVPYDSFNHLDFVWALNAKELLFDRIIEIMSNYTK